MQNQFTLSDGRDLLHSLEMRTKTFWEKHFHMYG